MIVHRDVAQGSDEWHALRCGLLTASEMKLILTPTLLSAANDKARQHVWEIAAQRITGHVEPFYVGEDMLRGWADEERARDAYSANFAPVEQVGFITNVIDGVTIGYSPDGLVGDDGLIEIKSRRQKYQVQSLVEYALNGTAPDDFALQVQTGLLITGRSWIDLVTYCGGLPMAPLRVLPNPAMQEAIITAAKAFEVAVAERIAAYHDFISNPDTRMVPTERVVEQEMFA